MSEIKSTEIVEYEKKLPVQFNQLALNTNLNHPPENWLRGNFSAEPWVPGGSKNRSAFRSFAMANGALDRVGKDDVITDRENVKKLLNLPYSKGSLSMMVHRIGRTIFIDDAYRHLLRAQEDDWAWIRQFLINQSVGSGQLLPRPAFSSEIEEKQMLSKFLYRSIENTDTVSSNRMVESQTGDVTMVTSQNQPLPLPDPLEADIESPEATAANVNLNWTFEDIHMLIGTDMPIFGCGKHPCVSLKLRDMKKPINVLTGLDYWLDQLMCNVPEVLMCYHLNGIVQKYEIMKTEDLPNLSGSAFGPELVRDVAQNILSFLKSNATKEGHTYWLFRGENDDVVKLYDLSSLCAEYMEDKDSNPFTLPVAILMYRVARNLMLQNQMNSNIRRVANTIYRLLNNCLELLSKDKYPQVVSSVHYLLSNLYLCYGSEGGQGMPTADVEDDWAVDDSWQNSTVGEASTAITMDVLTRSTGSKSPDKGRRGSKNKQSGSKTPNIRRIPLPNCTNLDDCCKQALEHVYEGLECTEVLQRSPSTTNQTENDEQVKKAVPTEPIPLRYEPLKKQQKTLLPFAVRRPGASSWQLELTALLMTRASMSYRFLAESSNCLGHAGRAMTYTRQGLLCVASVLAVCDCVKHSSASITRCREVVMALLPSFISHSGDVYVALFKVPVVDVQPLRHQQELDSDGKLHFRDRIIATKAKNYLTSVEQRIDRKYFWCVEKIPCDSTDQLLLAERCFEAALELVRNPATAVSPDRIRLSPSMAILTISEADVLRRLGSTKNELGSFYTNLLERTLISHDVPAYLKTYVDLSEESDPVQKLSQLAMHHFQNATKLFRAVDDVSNQALLHSNTARVYRLQSHSLAGEVEFGAKERHFMLKAIESYQRGLECVDRETDPVWELVTKELAGTYYTYALYLQDRPPMSTLTIDVIEREIADFMQKSLRLYDTLVGAQTSDALSLISLARQFEIHYRLASLYHKHLREKADNVRRSKQIRSVTEMHYTKAVESYDAWVMRSKSRTVHRCLEILRVQLERVALCEYFATGPSTNKTKPYNQALKIMIFDCKPDLAYLARNLPEAKKNKNDNNDEDEMSEEDENALSSGEQELLDEFCSLGRLFLDRIQNITKNMLQINVLALKKLSKASKDYFETQEKVTIWKKAYSNSLTVSGDESIQAKELVNLCDLLADCL